MIQLDHGSGGRATHDLIRSLFAEAFNNEFLSAMNDSAVLCLNTGRIAMTTDSYVVDPIFFPGGNIGSLAVHGTVNDLAMLGARPLYLTSGFILEEGLPLETLRQVVSAMAAAARGAGVLIVAGDTKVVPKREGGQDLYQLLRAGDSSGRVMHWRAIRSGWRRGSHQWDHWRPWHGGALQARRAGAGK